MDANALKRQAAFAALDFVKPGMRLGLGTGSTAAYFVEYLGERVAAGLDIACVATSQATAAQAQRLKIPLATLDDLIELDLTVDGADEIAPDLSLTKGGGGALLREKIVASASARMIVIADETKWVATLGRFPLPVEVVDFGVETTRRAVEAAAARCGCKGSAVVRLAKGGARFQTDGGNRMLDASFGRIENPRALAAALAQVPGVVDHGLFIDIADLAIIAGQNGLRHVGRS